MTTPRTEQVPPPNVELSIKMLVEALIESKGWMSAYADACIRDAIDRGFIHPPLPRKLITAEVTDGCAVKPVEKECPMPQISKKLVKQTVDALECLADDDNQASIISKLQSLLDQPEGEALKQITEADVTDEMLAGIEHHEERGIGKKTIAKIINIYLLEQP